MGLLRNTLYLHTLRPVRDCLPTLHWRSKELTNGVAGWPRPCTESWPDSYQAKTFTALQVTGNPPVETQSTAIILCSNQFPGTVVPTLTQGFTPTGDNPNPDAYLSLAGTLVHEMAHVVGRSRGTQCK